MWTSIHCIIIYNIQNMEATEVFIDGWIDKEGTYKQWNITQAIRNQNLDIRNNMGGPRGYHAKWSQRKKIPWSRLFVESKKQTKWDENRLKDTENKYGRGVEVAGEMMEIWKYKPPAVRY